MIDSQSAPADDAVRIGVFERHVMSCSARYVHDWLSMSFDALEGFDQIDFIIGAAVWNNNTRHINDDLALLKRFCFDELYIPLRMRTPTSRGATARFLGLSPETTRRRIDRLIRDGILADRPGGLVAVALARVVAANIVAVEHRSAELLAQLYRSLRDGGFDLPPAEWLEADGITVSSDWLRATTRFAADYVLLFLSEAAAAAELSLPEVFLVLSILRWDFDHRDGLDEGAFRSLILPDKYREPVRAIDAQLLAKQAHATARRRLLALEARGVIARKGAGYIVTAAILKAAVIDNHFLTRNYGYLRRMFERLHALAAYRRQTDASSSGSATG